MTLGERVKAVRQNAGLSQLVIATKSVSRADSLMMNYPSLFTAG